MKDPSDQIRANLAELERKASEYVEATARSILRRNKTIKEFVMAMGSAFFYSRDGDVLELDDRKSFKPLKDFIEEWDDLLKITGEPMRFTADGPKVTDW